MRIFNKVILLVAIAIFALCFSLGYSATPGKPKTMSITQYLDRLQNVGSKKKYVEDEVLVKFKKKTYYSQKLNVVSSMGDQKLSHIGKSGVMRVKLGKGKTVASAVASYRNNPDVEHVQPNYIYHATAVPGDTHYNELWGLHNSGQTISNPSYVDENGDPINNPGISGKDMNLESAWNEITDCSSVVVAVIDSGVKYTHEDLAANMWDGGSSFPNHGRDFVDDDYDPMDLNGHGTHVAGTIGAVGDNGKGITGVCWGAKLMAVRVLDEEGAGSSADIISGVNFATANGANIINMSLGGPNNDPLLEEAIEDARDAGILVVVAAGNETNNVDDADGTPSYPCSYTTENIVCVGALDQAYSLADFSNTGEISVDVAAPGANIMSTWIGTISVVEDDFNDGGTFDWNRSTDNEWDYQYIDNDHTLTNPENWDGSSAMYSPYLFSYVYKNFGNVAESADKVYINSMMNIDLLTEDYFFITYWDGSSEYEDVFFQIDNYNSDNEFQYLRADISQYASSNDHCEITFYLETNSTGNAYGVAIKDFSIETLTYNNNSFNTIDGTSMASPHVAGLAAMIMAQNPDYTWQDVKESIMAGGDDEAALDGTTVTGKAVDALGSLSYIKQTTGFALQQ